jgi:hypothetical protein
MTTLLPHDRAVWAKARTLSDLGDLTARWLLGQIQSQPGYFGSVDVDEAIAPGLTAALVQLNRLGVVTSSSQAGVPAGPGFDCATWAQRAAVDAYVDVRDLLWWTEAIQARGFGIHLVGERPARLGSDGVTVTTRNRRRYTHFGSWQSPEEIAHAHRGLHSEAILELQCATNVAIYDDAYGPNTLWPALRTIAEKRWSLR